MASNINKITFLLNGISSLLGWNAILSSFDYYASRYPTSDVYLWFPIPLFLMYVTIGLLWKQIHSRVAYKYLVVGGLVAVNIIMVALPLVANYVEGTSGFVICLILCGCLGIASNNSQLSFLALINYMSPDIVNIYNSGQAVCGLTMILTRMVILGIKGSDSNSFSAIIIYMIITIALNTVDIFLNIRFFRSQTFVNQIEPQQFQAIAESEQLAKTQNNGQGYFKKLYNTHKQIFPYDILIYLNYIQTFIVFPSLAYEKKFTMDPVWGQAILNLFVNIGDLLGRILCSYRKVFNRQSLYYMFFARFIFFWTMIALAKNINDPLINSDAFAFVNIFLFFLTNGIATNGNFIVTFQTVKVNKAYAGVLCGLLLQMGIFSGTLLAIPLSKAV